MKKKTVRPTIGTWYRATWGWSPEVKSFPIVSYTDNTVTYLESSTWGGSGPLREKRENRSNWGTTCWYPSFEEAKARVVSEFREKMKNAEKSLAEAELLVLGGTPEGSGVPVNN